MYVSNLALSDFRNYAEAVVEFEPGVMLLLGPNGQGKTNLVEAISYLATFSSHRVSADAALVKANATGAVIRAKAMAASGRSNTLELEVIAGRANRARLNRANAKPRDLLGIVRTVLFAPEDLALVKGDPSDRRRFLDELMVLRSPRLAGVKAEYDKILRQRSALLKQAGGGRGRKDEYAESTLDVWDAQMAAAGAQLALARAVLVQELAPHVAEAYREISASDRLASLSLRSSLEQQEARIAAGGKPSSGDEEDPAGLSTSSGNLELSDVAELTDRLVAAMRALRRAELERGVCLVGPHRDELELAIGDLPAKGYASHGESWSLALALRIGAFELLRAVDPDPPILILDDVFAELDTGRRDRLARMALRAEQVFVTAAVSSDVPAALGGVRYRVAAGTIEREEA